MIARLEALDLHRLQIEAALRGAEAMQSDIRSSLGHSPDSGHATPWEQTGHLRDSIEVSADDDGVVVGSTDPVAVDQELGTERIPPRPFLTPVAARSGAGLANAVGDAVRAAVTGGQT